MRRSSATSSRPGSGPPSMSSRPPCEPSTRIASPCPTSRTLTRATPVGRLTTTAPATTMAITSAATAARVAPDDRGSGLVRDPASGSMTSGGAAAGRRPRQRAWTAASATSVAIAATAAAGPGSVTLANGSPAIASTIATMSRSRTQPGAARTLPTTGGSADRDEEPAEHRDESGGHRGRHERHDGKVDDRREDGEPPEGRQHDGQGRGLCRERHAEALGQPARQVTSPDPVEPRGQRRRPRDQAGGRQRRQLEAGVADERRVGDEQEHRRPRECRRSSAGATGFARQQDDARHGASTHDRGRGASERDIGDDRDHRQDRSTPPTHPSGQGGDRRGHDRDVPARDRDDVADAGRREGGGQVAVDPVAKTDQDPGGQPGLRFGQDRRQRGRRRESGGPDRLDRTRRRVLDRHRSRGQCADRPDPLEVLTVRRGGTRSDGSLDRQAVARHDLRVRGQRRGDADPRWLVATDRAQRRGLLAVTWRPDRLDLERPRPAAIGHDLGGRGSRRPDRKADEEQRRPRRGPRARSGRPAAGTTTTSTTDSIPQGARSPRRSTSR